MSATFSSLKYRNYRLWFTGALVANIGTWMQRVAQDWLVLTQLTNNSGVALGVVTGLQFAPALFVSPWALHFTGMQHVAMDAWIVGILFFLIGIWGVVAVRQVETMHLQH